MQSKREDFLFNALLRPGILFYLYISFYSFRHSTGGYISINHHGQCTDCPVHLFSFCRLCNRTAAEC